MKNIADKQSNYANLERFLIRKREINNELWKQILSRSKGKPSDKILACKLIFQNYSFVPLEADEILKEFAASTQPKDVRKAIAHELSKEKVEIPAGLYFDLLNILANDPSDEVRRIVEPKFKLIMEPFMQIAQLLREYQTNLMINIIKNSLIWFQKVDTIFSHLIEFSKFLREPEFKDFEYNWLIFLPIDKMRKLYEAHKEGRDDEIKKLLIKISRHPKFVNQLIKKMEGSDTFKPRVTIIREAIEAHIEGKYSLSIPVFLAQIEGILWDYAERMGLVNEAKTIRSNKKIKIVSIKPLIRDTSLRDKVSELITDYFLKEIYTENFRHGILHGRITDYNKEENSMKLLLFIRALLEACD
ncbi:hypothetical protein J7K27_07425 [Candidatus Bathyarchaeota archaeon]|nr:hypothetical protein [Candidatus Bathyarchaeota archaeon]